MLALTPLVVEAKSSVFDLSELVDRKLGARLRDGDVLVVSSKFVAVSEGRIVKLNSVRPRKEARGLSSEYKMDPRLCELILRESDGIVGGIPGFILAIKDGLLVPNAGIDKSNVRHGAVVLYPRRPALSAWRLREALKFSRGVTVGVVVCDSRLSPTRRGTTGVAVAASGVEAVLDMRGRTDLFGNVLKVTAQGVADDLCSAAEILMGESDESIPVVLVRGLARGLIRNTEYGGRRFAIPVDDCVYLRSLGYPGISA